MKKSRVLVGLLLAGGLVSAALAGGSSYKCTKSTDECLNAMVSDMKARGWVGMELDKTEAGALVVKRVVPGTLAESAGIQVGDELVALNGIKFADEKNKEALMAAKKSQKVGSEIRYTISRSGATKEVALKLAPVPEDVMAQWVGQHMLEHANTAIAKN